MYLLRSILFLLLNSERFPVCVASYGLDGVTDIVMAAQDCVLCHGKETADAPLGVKDCPVPNYVVRGVYSDNTDAKGVFAVIYNITSGLYFVEKNRHNKKN